MKDSLPLPEDRFIKLSLDQIGFICLFLLRIQKDYPDSFLIQNHTNLVIDLLLDQLSEDDKKLMIGK